MKDGNLVKLAVEAVGRADKAFCKFTAANDAGSTGAHQAGYYMPKSAWSLMFDQPGVRGENKDRTVKIKWQKDFETESRFIYYGKGTRNEYRLTRFGRNFPYLTEDNVGDLFILCHIEGDFYEGYILSADEDIEEFLDTFGLSPTETNALINRNIEYSPKDILTGLFRNILERHDWFPETSVMAKYAKDSYMQAHKINKNTICSEPDKQLLAWIDTEYELFRAFEAKLYDPVLKTGFSDIESLISYSNQILNRRKSRAGKSLEHHLETIFKFCDLKFETQVITEEHKKPDFIFPDGASYHNFEFPADDLICLGAKTTCKDRWRQILNEADRIPVKHLFTLQQGVSKNQLAEMYREKVCLVVPKPYIRYFDESFQDKIMPLNVFTGFVKAKQNGL